MADFETRVQQRAEAHLEACEEALFAEPDDPDDVPPTPASAPFCGCNTCIVREVLHASWEEMLAEARREVVRERNR